MKKLALVALSIILSGCASVISGTTQDLTFDSSPQGAKVYLDGKIIGQTPFTFTAAKNKYNSLRVEKEGYLTISRTVSKSYDPVTILSLFWDYSTTDALTGAMYMYDDSSYFFDLQEKK